MLKADIGKGYNGCLRYYLAQLMRLKRADGQQQYTLWTRWGRMGERRYSQCTPFANDLVAALKEFKKVTKQKCGHSWESIKESGDSKIELIKGKYRVL